MSAIVYAKIVSVGDLCPQGMVPMTLEGTDGVRRLIMLEASQCRYWAARLEAINAERNPSEVRSAS
jgi:hypothetical protein